MPSNKVDLSALPYRACVGICLFNRIGQVWIGRRIAEVDGDVEVFAWQMPQGGIDDGEAPREAAFRELGEEVGTENANIVSETSDWLSYDLPADRIGKALKGKYRGQRQKWFAMRFNGDDSEFDIGAKPGHKAEFDAWRWAPLDDLPGLVVPFKRPVYEALIVEFAGLPERIRE